MYYCCSVTQECQNICNPMDCSMPDSPVHHQLPELAQTHVHWVGDAIQPLCHPLLLLPSVFPRIRIFLMSEFLAWGGQSIGVSASTSVHPMNIQDWFPLGWTGWISLLSKALSRVFSNTTVQKHQFFDIQLSVQLLHPYMTTGKTIALTGWTFVGKVISLLFNMLSRLVITFLPRSRHLLISWLQSSSAVILGRHNFFFYIVLKIIIFNHFKHCHYWTWILDGHVGYLTQVFRSDFWIRGTKLWLEIAVCSFHLHLMRKLWPLFSLMWILPSLSMPLTCTLDYYNTFDFGLLLSFGWWGMQQSICLWVATAGSILYQCFIVKCNGAVL